MNLNINFPHDSICHTVCVFYLLICNFSLNLMLVSYDLLLTIDTWFETDEVKLSCHDWSLSMGCYSHVWIETHMYCSLYSSNQSQYYSLSHYLPVVARYFLSSTWWNGNWENVVFHMSQPHLTLHDSVDD
jgi:hypothetical protein